MEGAAHLRNLAEELNTAQKWEKGDNVVSQSNLEPLVSLLCYNWQDCTNPPEFHYITELFYFLGNNQA